MRVDSLLVWGLVLHRLRVGTVGTRQVATVEHAGMGRGPLGGNPLAGCVGEAAWYDNERPRWPATGHGAAVKPAGLGFGPAGRPTGGRLPDAQ